MVVKLLRLSEMHEHELFIEKKTQATLKTVKCFLGALNGEDGSCSESSDWEHQNNLKKK